jgi:hypothetical protein
LGIQPDAAPSSDPDACRLGRRLWLTTALFRHGGTRPAAAGAAPHGTVLLRGVLGAGRAWGPAATGTHGEQARHGGNGRGVRARSCGNDRAATFVRPNAVGGVCREGDASAWSIARRGPRLCWGAYLGSLGTMASGAPNDATERASAATGDGRCICVESAGAGGVPQGQGHAYSCGRECRGRGHLGRRRQWCMVTDERSPALPGDREQSGQIVQVPRQSRGL